MTYSSERKRKMYVCIGILMSLEEAWRISFESFFFSWPFFSLSLQRHTLAYLLQSLINHNVLFTRLILTFLFLSSYLSFFFRCTTYGFFEASNSFSSFFHQRLAFGFFLFSFSSKLLDSIVFRILPHHSCSVSHPPVSAGFMC